MYQFLICVVWSLSCFASTPLSSYSPQEKPTSTAEKLIGVWRPTKTQSELPKDAKVTVEFKKQGVLEILISTNDSKLKIDGTWKLDGDTKIITVIQLPNGEERKETQKIEKLTDKVLITIDEDNKKDEFEKVK